MRRHRSLSEQLLANHLKARRGNPGASTTLRDRVWMEDLVMYVQWKQRARNEAIEQDRAQPLDSVAVQ